MKKTFLQKLGLLGIVSLLSYTAAVVFSPLAYPGYDWMAQAVSDLSAADAPSLALWNRLSGLRHGGMYRHTGAENQAAAHGRIPVCRHGMDLGHRVPDVPPQQQRLCGGLSGCDAYGGHGGGGDAVHCFADLLHRSGDPE